MANKVKSLETERPNFTIGINEKNKALQKKEQEDKDQYINLTNSVSTEKI